MSTQIQFSFDEIFHIYDSDLKREMKSWEWKGRNGNEREGRGMKGKEGEWKGRNGNEREGRGMKGKEMEGRGMKGKEGEWKGRNGNEREGMGMTFSYIRYCKSWRDFVKRNGEWEDGQRIRQTFFPMVSPFSLILFAVIIEVILAVKRDKRTAPASIHKTHRIRAKIDFGDLSPYLDSMHTKQNKTKKSYW